MILRENFYEVEKLTLNNIDKMIREETVGRIEGCFAASLEGIREM